MRLKIAEKLRNPHSPISLHPMVLCIVDGHYSMGRTTWSCQIIFNRQLSGSWMLLRLIFWKYCLFFDTTTDPVEILNWLKSVVLCTFLWRKPLVILNALNALRLLYFKLKTKLVYYDPFQMIEIYYGPILCLAIHHILHWCIMIYQNSKSADIVHLTCHVNLFKSPIWKINRTCHAYHPETWHVGLTIGRSRGGIRDACPRVQILSFPCSFRQKIWELAPPQQNPGSATVDHGWI